jgi:hypothetical protein
VQWLPRNDPFRSEPREQRAHLVRAAINAVGRIKGRRRRVALNDELALAPRVVTARKTSMNSGSTRTSPSLLCDFGR